MEVAQQTTYLDPGRQHTSPTPLPSPPRGPSYWGRIQITHPSHYPSPIHHPYTHTPDTHIYLSHNLAEVYSHQVYEGIYHMDPTAPLGQLTSQLSSILHTAFISDFPHHTYIGGFTPVGTMPQNRWYDDGWRELYQHLHSQRAMEEITECQAANA